MMDGLRFPCVDREDFMTFDRGRDHRDAITAVGKCQCFQRRFLAKDLYRKSDRQTFGSSDTVFTTKWQAGSRLREAADCGRESGFRQLWRFPPAGVVRIP